MIWVHPDKNFDQESKTLVKIQIDNSRELGWRDKDIMLFTNFDYEYDGLKATVVGNDAFCDIKPVSTKLTSILKLFELGYIKDETYWVHDLDCYQLVPFKKNEILLDTADMALCDYGRKKNKWSGGSIFFKYKARDIFEKQHEIMVEYKCIDETALLSLTRSDPEVLARIRKLNSTYHFLPFNVRNNYRFANKPLRIAHFHPGKYEKRTQMMTSKNLFEFYCGNNKAGVQLIPDRLIKIFNKHGIK